MNTLYRIMAKWRKKQGGFTLIELVLVTAIFAITIVLAVDIFLVVTKLQRKAVSSQRLQGDARFTMELMAKDVRLGQIDYGFYADLATQCAVANASCAVDFSDTVPILALRDTQGEQIVYRRTDATTPQQPNWSLWHGGGTSLEVCIGDCLSTNAIWEEITPEGVHVVSTKFYIQPGEDPFTPTSGSFTNNRQPLVTIQLGTQGEGSNIEEQGYIFLQTTVSTRIYER